MTIEKIALRILPALERSLRHIYPLDYPYRCFQASIALNALLDEAGYKTRIVSGDFEIAVRNSKTGRLEFHGFTSRSSDCAHFWVEAAGHTIDVMPRYLPRSSDEISMVPPIICWSHAEVFHPAIRYAVRNEVPPLRAMMRGDDQQTIALLLADMRRRLTRKGAHQPARPYLMRPTCILTLARKKDPWATFVQSAFVARSDKPAGRPGPAVAPQAPAMLFQGRAAL